jgi:hypothetical protein
MQNRPPDKSLRVQFPFAALHVGERIIDLADLDHVSEFYLAENLGIGLIRDAHLFPGGFRPGLAKSWRQIELDLWEFQIDPEAKWSDGTAIAPRLIEEHVRSLRTKPSRHFVQLRSISEVSLHDASSLLVRFEHETDRSILDEFALADAVLERREGQPWRVTSGPYYVEQHCLEERKISLKVNPFSKLIHERSPKEIELFGLESLSQFGELFRDIETDLAVAPVPPLIPALTVVRKNAPRSTKGYETSIYFLVVDSNHPLGQDVAARREFACLASKAFRLDPPYPLVAETQLVPKEYAGRLSGLLDLIQLEPNVLRGKSIVVGFHPFFGQGSSLQRMSSAQSVFRKCGVDLKFEYHSPLGQGFERKLFADLFIFRGNQNDMLGSWSFLISRGGPLWGYRNELLPMLERAGQVSGTHRSWLLEDLHRKVLGNGIAVPLFAAAPEVFHSERVELSNWNPFDFRLRMYDIALAG